MLKTDQLNGLIALKVVSETRNFRAAADKLGISPSAVSQSIKHLESRLGVPLLSRTTRSTSLTEAGENFLKTAGPALDQILLAIDGVGDYTQKPSGVLRLNMPRLIYPKILSPIISSFTKKYPEITVQIVFDDKASDIVADGFDAGIRLSDILVKDMVAVRIIGPVKFIIAGSPIYFEKRGKPKQPQDLLNHNCILPGSSKSNAYDNWEFEHKEKEFAVKVNGNLIMNDYSQALNSAVDGAGLIYTIQEAIESEIKTGKLEIVLQQYAATSAGFFLYYPSQSQVLPKLRVFIDHLKSKRF